MLAHKSNRSEEASAVVKFLQSHEWGVMVLDEVPPLCLSPHVSPPLFSFSPILFLFLTFSFLLFLSAFHLFFLLSLPLHHLFSSLDLYMYTYIAPTSIHIHICTHRCRLCLLRSFVVC